MTYTHGSITSGEMDYGIPITSIGLHYHTISLFPQAISHCIPLSNTELQALHTFLHSPFLDAFPALVQEAQHMVATQRKAELEAIHHFGVHMLAELIQRLILQENHRLRLQ